VFCVRPTYDANKRQCCMRCCSLRFVKKYYIACVNRGLVCEVPLRNTLLHEGVSYVWKQQQLVVGISKHFGMYMYTYIMIGLHWMSSLQSSQKTATFLFSKTSRPVVDPANPPPATYSTANRVSFPKSKVTGA